jgi:hypothetical protein
MLALHIETTVREISRNVARMVVCMWMPSVSLACLKSVPEARVHRSTRSVSGERLGSAGYVRNESLGEGLIYAPSRNIPCAAGV